MKQLKCIFSTLICLVALSAVTPSVSYAAPTGSASVQQPKVARSANLRSASRTLKQFCADIDSIIDLLDAIADLKNALSGALVNIDGAIKPPTFNDRCFNFGLQTPDFLACLDGVFSTPSAGFQCNFNINPGINLDADILGCFTRFNINVPNPLECIQPPQVDIDVVLKDLTGLFDGILSALNNLNIGVGLPRVALRMKLVCQDFRRGRLKFTNG